MYYYCWIYFNVIILQYQYPTGVTWQYHLDAAVTVHPGLLCVCSMFVLCYMLYEEETPADMCLVRFQRTDIDWMGGKQWPVRDPCRTPPWYTRWMLYCSLSPLEINKVTKRVAATWSREQTTHEFVSYVIHSRVSRTEALCQIPDRWSIMLIWFDGWGWREAISRRQWVY